MSSSRPFTGVVDDERKRLEAQRLSDALEAWFNELQRKKYLLEQEERKAKVLSKLYMLPEGWEEKVAAAAVESLKSGAEHITLELVEFNMETKRTVTVGIRTDLFAFDYSDRIEENERERLLRKANTD